MQRRPILFALTTLLTLTLAGCGFQMRGPQPLPFSPIYIEVPDTSEFGAQLKRAIRTSGAAQLAPVPEQAQAVFKVVSTAADKQILSVNAAGLVREYQLRLFLTYRVVTPDGKELVPATQLSLTRDLSFNPASTQEVLAKGQEETLLQNDMQSELVKQVLRRLAAAKPPAALLQPPATSNPAAPASPRP